MPGVRPTISGGRLIRNWQRSSAGVAALYEADLEEAGISPGELGELSPRGWAQPYVWQSCGDYGKARPALDCHGPSLPPVFSGPRVPLPFLAINAIPIKNAAFLLLCPSCLADIEYCPFTTVMNEHVGDRFASALELFSVPEDEDARNFKAGFAQLVSSFPNKDMLGIAATPGSAYRPWLNGTVMYGGGIEASDGRRGFRLRSDRAQQWNLSKTVQQGNDMVVHIAQAWKDAHCVLGGIGASGDNSTSTSIWLSTKDNSSCTGQAQTVDATASDDARFYFYNAFAELDSEGQQGFLPCAHPLPAGSAATACSAQRVTRRTWCHTLPLQANILLTRKHRRCTGSRR